MDEAGAGAVDAAAEAADASRPWHRRLRRKEISLKVREKFLRESRKEGKN